MPTPRVLWIADQAGDVVSSERLSITVVTTLVEGFEQLHARISMRYW